LAIITDGAKANDRFEKLIFDLIKQQGLKFPMFLLVHCINQDYKSVNQEALCGKVVKLCTAMQTVTKIINVIKDDQKLLSHRKFQNFLGEHNAIYTDVYCKIRWLSAGKCLEKFFTVRKEVFLFLQDQVPTEYNKFKFFLKIHFVSLL